MADVSILNKKLITIFLWRLGRKANTEFVN